MGKTDAATRRQLNATIRQAGLSIGVHLCRFCEADPPEHGRCAEATEDPFVCYCDCSELDNREFDEVPDYRLADLQPAFGIDAATGGAPYIHTLRPTGEIPTFTVERSD